jgi:hypothetical protein
MTSAESLASPTPDGTHADVETLTRLIDGELLDDDRSAAAHAAGCVTCQARIDVLRRRRGRLTEILLATDVPPVAAPNVADVLARAAQRRAAARHRFRRPTRRMVAAAGLILSGAALAAQPVGRWVMARWQKSERPSPVPPPANVGAEPAPSPAAIAFIPHPGDFTIRFDVVPASGTLTLRGAADTRVNAGITDGAKEEGFFVLPDGLRIRNSATSVASYHVSLPPGVARVRVRIGSGAQARTVTVRLEAGRTHQLTLGR